MRLWIAPLFVVCPLVGALIGANSAIASVPGRNDSYFGDLTGINQFVGGVLGAIQGGLGGFVVALLVWAIVLALSDARHYDEFEPLRSGSNHWPKSIYVLRWPAIFLSAVMIFSYLGSQLLQAAVIRISQPSGPVYRVPTPAPTFVAVLPDQQAEIRRAQFEVPKLLGDWFYPNAQIWPCSQPRPLVQHSMIILLSKDSLSRVISYYALRMSSLDRANIVTRFVGHAPRPGDGRDTFISVNQKGDFVYIQFSTS